MIRRRLLMFVIAPPGSSRTRMPAGATAAHTNAAG
jgi:hypothetical protein